MEKSAVEAPQQQIVDRLRSFSKELYSLDQKPLLDPFFSFPWDDYAASLMKIFGCTISLTPDTVEWKAKTALFEGISTPYAPIAIDLPGITGTLQLIISRADFENLMSLVLKIEVDRLQQQDPAFIDQFILFATTQLIACTQAAPSLKSLSPRLSIPTDIPEPGALTLDIHITIGETNGLARLIIPPQFLESWKKARSSDKQASSPTWNELSTTLAVEAGRTFLTPQEIASIQLGDFLPIQHPFFIPDSQKSRMYLTLHGKPLFRAKIKDEKVQILEMPLEHEAFTPIGGLTMPAKPQESLPQAEEMPLLQSEETNPFETEEEEEKESPQPVTAEEMKATTVSSRLAKEPLQLEDIPLPIIVQLAEITMSVAQIAALQPGNLLDLQIRPENGVSLVVNNRVFATADLVMIGDNVGVQIKELGLKPPKE